MNTEYDRYAKSLWINIYQDELHRSYDREQAKESADLAVADYMKSIHSDYGLEKLTENGWIEVPFKLNSLNKQGCIRYLTEDRTSVLYMHDFCRISGIDQTRIKRILLKMKSEDE